MARGVRRVLEDLPGWYAVPDLLEVPPVPARHAVAFDLGGVVPFATRLPVVLAAAGGWQDTRLLLPNGGWRDLLTGDRFVSDVAGLPVGPALARLPVALLTRD